MSILTITVDDASARLVEEAAHLEQKAVARWLEEHVRLAAVRTVEQLRPAPASRRVSPLHPGSMVAAPDFNAPLEEFAPYA